MTRRFGKSFPAVVFWQPEVAAERRPRQATDEVDVMNCRTIARRGVCWLTWVGVVLGSRLAVLAADANPPAKYLMWRQDPATTQVVLWHTTDPSAASQVEYRLRGSDAWTTATGSTRPFPHAQRTIHEVTLTGLAPGSDYEYRLAGFTATETFRTLPATLDAPLKFVVGGDCGIFPAYGKLLELAARREPAFGVVGGDLAYENGDPAKSAVFLQWLKVWSEKMITAAGRRIPLVVAIGNHEVQGGYHQPKEKAPYFYASFALPGPSSYGVLDFGDYLSLFLLDTEHNHPIPGPQTEWLAEQLRARRERPHLMAAYHVPGFPSHREFEGTQSRLVREHWVPLFDECGLDVAFEHHDHTYKRTYHLRGGAVDPSGTLYLGDGCMGQFARRVKPWHETWYLAASDNKQHFIQVTIEPSGRNYEAIQPQGTVIDRFAELGP